MPFPLAGPTSHFQSQVKTHPPRHSLALPNISPHPLSTPREGDMLGSAFSCILQCLLTGLPTCPSVSPEDCKCLRAGRDHLLSKRACMPHRKRGEDDAKMTESGSAQPGQPSEKRFSNYGWQHPDPHTLLPSSVSAIFRTCRPVSLSFSNS